ncbi:FAD-binding oxidoreductase [Cucumibacter marinus]|uniref:FAD-binding oxidoreductase n=1 Tax=Cucumibacter marinus TaxID=1121252 RepID=UPI00041D096F|nr:FAD-binding oxidoreductase [Cucumibacter marinus]
MTDQNSKIEGNGILESLAGLIDARDVIAPGADMEGYIHEHRHFYHTPAAAVVTPRDIESIQRIVKWANETGHAIIPQGGNTGLVGGQVPKSGQEIILALKHLNQVRRVDPVAGVMVCEAGVTVHEAQQAAEAVDRLYPLSLASEGTAQIGGTLSTNAGGVNALTYGNARDLCFGIEAVLPDGRIYEDLSALRKDNTGYSLRNLLIGAEGTLGIITAASLRLFPRPKAFETAYINVEDPEAAIRLHDILKAAAGSRLTSIELIPRIGVELQLKHGLIDRDPAASESPWHVLAEISLFGADEPGRLMAALETAFEEGVVTDAALAENLTHRELMWKQRESMSECQSREGDAIKHDVSVPVTAVPELIARGDEACEKLVPGIRSVAFGHLGDGNVHYDFVQPAAMAKGEFKAHFDALHEVIYGIVADLGGSFSAEHGIGQMKVGQLARVKNPVALDMMRQIKSVLDPNRVLNPGKVIEG